MNVKLGSKLHDLTDGVPLILKKLYKTIEKMLISTAKIEYFCLYPGF